jgi:hypothetical protein
MLWNGIQWVSVWPSGDPGQALLTAGYGGIAQIPGTRPSWLAMTSCAAQNRGCRGQIWVAGTLPR